MDEDIPSIDSLFEMEAFNQEVQYFLIIGKYAAYKELMEFFPQDLGYELIHAGGAQDATLYLMEKEILIVFIDVQDERINPISISNSLRQTNPHVRIVIISPKIISKHLADIYNLGLITGFLETPYSPKSLMKIISEQEARYSIDKMVTSFVQEPPKLSKASFLLLDPSLTFDEGAPVNFVGLMIVSHTVPKFTQWFEETLSQDEYLLAGYLSSITALGNDLFDNQQALKEINFGGISVIFRFHESIQFSFLVKNLTKHNFEKAEQRITNLVNQIIAKYGDTLNTGFLTDEDEMELVKLSIDFDMQDEEGIEVIEDVESIFSMPESLVLLYGNNEFQQQYLIKELEKLNSEETEYDTMNLNFNLVSTTDEEEAVETIRNKNCDVVLIDTNLTRGRSPDDFADFTKEMKPLISVIILESHEYASATLISAINNDTIEFVMPSDDTPSEIMNYVLKGVIRSRTLAEKSTISDELENSRDSFTIAKMKLRENLESFDQEEQPVLHGLIITLEMRQIYERFWEDVKFDKEMISGLVESLKNVGGEMFTQKEQIDGLELGGTSIFVREQLEYLFIYFVKNVSPNTSVVIGKEVDTITELFRDVIAESSGLIPMDELKPFFDKIAIKAHYSFTEILSEIAGDVETKEDFGLVKPEDVQPEEIEKIDDISKSGDPQTMIQNSHKIDKPEPGLNVIPDISEELNRKVTPETRIPQVPDIKSTEIEVKEENIPQNVPTVPSVHISEASKPSESITQNDDKGENIAQNVPGVPAVSISKSDDIEDGPKEIERIDNLTDNAKRLRIPKVPSVNENSDDEEGSN